MTIYNVLADFDENSKNRFKSIIVSPVDMKKCVQWSFDHQKGREFVKKSFGKIRHMWHPDDDRDLPIADFPSSCAVSGFFSEKAVYALRNLLEKHGDLHNASMETGENYYLYDCWSFIDFCHIGIANIYDGGHIKSVTAEHDDFVFPEVFAIKGRPGLIVGEQFKKIADNNGFTGMIFSPVKVNRISDLKDYEKGKISVVTD